MNKLLLALAIILAIALTPSLWQTQGSEVDIKIAELCHTHPKANCLDIKIQCYEALSKGHECYIFTNPNQN